MAGRFLCSNKLFQETEHIEQLLRKYDKASSRTRPEIKRELVDESVADLKRARKTFMERARRKRIENHPNQAKTADAWANLVQSFIDEKAAEQARVDEVQGDSKKARMSKAESPPVAPDNGSQETIDPKAMVEVDPKAMVEAVSIWY